MEEKKLKPNGGYPMHTFEDLRALYAVYIRDVKSNELIKKAYAFASEKHAGIFRKSGEAYIQHPIEVAYICAQLQSGPATIISALLHDVVEDTDTKLEVIIELFGEDVGKIVNALTKIQRMKLSHMTAEDFEAEDHRKIFLGMAQDVRVIIVKLADRLHNLRTLDSLSKERQLAISRETLDVFTPIAHRLGIYTVQSEMEDLSLKYLEPAKYNEILGLVNEKYENRKSSLESLKKRIADSIYAEKIPFKIESRVKSIYSIYKKMYLKGHSFDDIYDVLAIRVITKTVVNCYEILGLIHQSYSPIPGRFKDYIAMPKPNMYQSLHTSIIAGDGNAFEVQIRTEEMDQVAETGVAAHWKYKETANKSAKEEQKEIEEKLHWFRDFVSLSGESKDDSAKDYIKSLTNDIFGANVYVFTPLGKVIEIPSGATTLDFAYKIHTKVGDNAIGAIVNGVGVPLNTILKTGDICEIRTSKTSSGPNSSWLDIAKTASAKAHIRKALQKKDAEIMKEERSKNGRQSLLDAFRLQGYTSEEEIDKILSTNENKLRNEFHFDDLEDFYVMINSRNPAPAAVLEFLRIKRRIDIFENAKRKNKNQKSFDDSSLPVYVNGGVTGLAISLAQCCCPIPGDDITGYITKGKGITVHRKSCPNVANQSRRLIDVHWKDNLGMSSYNVDIEIYANDRTNLVADILATLASKGIGITDLNAHLIKENMNTVVNLTVTVPGSKDLSDAFALLLGIKGIYSVNRVIH
ncbi:MAG: bifunctional (p)ppGpp synthetase/guanosine-3',5'-bis(diphosphate) 3'-pyrophosphohydrolase [Bacilli bacterium]|nr:bifunctional (p)ppGpp synthetase/guanosine-3',5'-bis(diphosphate) 3'-pyrophosphohydrolase [Bacilli bacterium]MDY6430647.1 bifunctional (p)ppGpp synthetase/guanosine-3',5'-bis(diphosphate) 3'-pyrophosphohydrolase [Bacilli bacterium]